jgi:thiamine biosynthesis protein ThiI
MSSQDLNCQLGARVLEQFPHLKVSLNAAELEIEVRIFKEAIFLAVEKYTGIGGHPVGMSGHVVTLISGGLDSPVASVLMSKRGCKQTLVFFYARPFVGPAVVDKIKLLTAQLAPYQVGCMLAIVPFGNVQKEMAARCRNDYRTLFIRLLMVKCAALLAKEFHAQALVTGDSLSQVSSQTIWNLCALDAHSRLPIFRPLIGLNKSEIIELSRRYGLFNISVMPHDDACALFAPVHPIIKADPGYVEEFVQTNELRFSELLQSAVSEMETFHFDLLGRPVNQERPAQ